MSSLGPLVPADEMLVHQIADTFATVSQSDRSWTEKVWAMATDRQGAVQLVFGLGVYPNRGVIDAFGGVSRGVEQWTVRASGRLGKDPNAGTVGPFRYEIVEPLKKIRFALAASSAAPVSFEWLFDAAVPPGLERREQHRGASGRRIAADVVRYHQVGSAQGWADVDGSHVEVSDDTWVSARDHSWGVRYGVGEPVEDALPDPDRGAVSSLILWCPVLCESAGQSAGQSAGDAQREGRYSFHWYYQRHSLGTWSRDELQGGIEYPDGKKSRFVAMNHQLVFRPDNRRFVEGTIEFTMEDGSKRPITMRAVSDTGFQLGSGLYMGYEGQWHGQWRGENFLEGEHIADCSDPVVAARLHQLRDCVVEIDDPVGGGKGWGNLQSIVTGAHDDMGLDAEGSFT